MRQVAGEPTMPCVILFVPRGISNVRLKEQKTNLPRPRHDTNSFSFWYSFGDTTCVAQCSIRKPENMKEMPFSKFRKESNEFERNVPTFSGALRKIQRQIEITDANDCNLLLFFRTTSRVIQLTSVFFSSSVSVFITIHFVRSLWQVFPPKNWVTNCAPARSNCSSARTI